MRRRLRFLPWTVAARDSSAAARVSSDRVYWSTWGWFQLRDGGAGSNSGSYEEVYPSSSLYRRAPVTFGEPIHWKFAKEMFMEARSTFVAEIADGCAWGRDGAVVTSHGMLLADVSLEPGQDSYRDPREHSFFQQQSPVPERISGTVVVLSNLHGHKSYFHWLFDVIPRLALLRKSQVPLTGDEKYLVNSLDYTFQSESLALAGVAPRNIICGDSVPYLQADRLIVPSYPGLSGIVPKWACDFLRESMLGDVSPKGADGRRIYISRRHASRRQVLNEDELTELLQEFGFCIVDPADMSVREQARLFSSASLVVSQHGAGLANLVFCPEGAAVLELFTPNLMNACYWAVSNLLGIRYHYLTFPHAPEPSQARAHDMMVDLARLSGALKQIGVARR